MEAAIAAATEEARALGGNKASITVQVESGNLRAQRLYERVGFKVVDEAIVIENHRGTKSVAVCLELEVDISTEASISST
jgi:ribosomal protein S18 acetylase RimI-like enzyme